VLVLVLLACGLIEADRMALCHPRGKRAARPGVGLCAGRERDRRRRAAVGGVWR
jgi:hypothetical protein